MFQCSLSLQHHCAKRHVSGGLLKLSVCNGEAVYFRREIEECKPFILLRKDKCGNKLIFIFEETGQFSYEEIF